MTRELLASGRTASRPTDAVEARDVAKGLIARLVAANPQTVVPMPHQRDEGWGEDASAHRAEHLGGRGNALRQRNPETAAP